MKVLCTDRHYTYLTFGKTYEVLRISMGSDHCKGIAFYWIVNDHGWEDLLISTRFENPIMTIRQEKLEQLGI